MFSLYHSAPGVTKTFRCVEDAFLQSDGLRLADVLPEAEIAAAFAAENVSFASDERDTYTPAVTLWAWLSQAMQDGVRRSCVAAVSRVIVLSTVLGRRPPSPDTGDYCRARAKLPRSVLERLVYRAADELEARVPADWLWLGRHVKIADGTTLLTADTDANQAAWPQTRAQQPGVGFPILRMVVLLSLATAALCPVAVGPCRGKETGETALLTRQHQRRRTDFRRGQWLAYNLIRKVMSQAALCHERLPRELSFAAGLAAVTEGWDQATVAPPKKLRTLAESLWRVIAWHGVGHRPDRVEPRALKRRPKPHRLLTKPRAEARAELLEDCHDRR